MIVLLYQVRILADFEKQGDRLYSILGTYRLCFTNDQYFTSKLIYIGVLAIHSERVSEAKLKTEEEKNNNSAAIDEFSARAMVTILIFDRMILNRREDEQKECFFDLKRVCGTEMTKSILDLSQRHAVKNVESFG